MAERPKNSPLTDEQWARVQGYNDKLSEQLYVEFPELIDAGQVGGAITGGVLAALANNLGGLLAGVRLTSGPDFCDAMKSKIFERIENAANLTQAMVESEGATKN